MQPGEAEGRRGRRGERCTAILYRLLPRVFPAWRPSAPDMNTLTTL